MELFLFTYHLAITVREISCTFANTIAAACVSHEIQAINLGSNPAKLIL